MRLGVLSWHNVHITCRVIGPLGQKLKEPHTQTAWLAIS